MRMSALSSLKVRLFGSEGRGFARLNFWWFPKVAPVLAVSLCAAIVFKVPAWVTFRSILLIAFVGLCAGTYGYLINDIFDLEVDRKAGKRNPMAEFSSTQCFLFCVTAVAFGFGSALFVSYSRTSLLLLGLEYLLPTMYSVPPIRLKVRGILGLFCDAFGAHVAPCLYVISVMAHERTTAVHASPSGTVFTLLVCFWGLCLGLTGIVVHEMEDRDNDLWSGIRTFATGTTFAKVRLPLSLIHAGELLTFALLCGLLWRTAPLLGILAGVYVAMIALRLWTRWSYFRLVTRENVVIEWWQLSHPFYEGNFLLAVSLQCAWLHPSLAVLPVLQCVLMAASLRAQFHELRNAYSMLVLGGQLHLDGSSVARVRAILFPEWARRIEIFDGGAERWEIRAVHGGLNIQSGQQYLMKLKMRADQPREIMFGVWQDHEPWQALGYCEGLSLSQEWQTIWREFTAPVDERHAYMGLWLGGHAGSVDVRGWSIETVNTNLSADAKADAE